MLFRPKVNGFAALEGAGVLLSLNTEKCPGMKEHPGFTADC